MDFQLSNHAESEVKRRDIPQDLFQSILDKPEQIVEARGNKKAHQ